MRLRHTKTLITGKPEVGKTTLVQKIIERMRSVKMTGFCTAEIRGMGSPLGFELQGLNGERRTLAQISIFVLKPSPISQTYLRFLKGLIFSP